jgi:Lon-like ATP-dependent protease
LILPDDYRMYLLTLHHQNIKEGIEGKPVSWYSEVFDLVFPDIDAAQANTRWKKELAKPPKEERDDDDDHN